MNKKIIMSAIIIFVCVLAVTAQVPPPGSGGTLPPDGIPIDGGLGLLLAGMAGYAYKKFKKDKQ